MSDKHEWMHTMQEKLVENAIPLSQEVGFSVVAGYASGLALRFAGKVAAVTVGGAFVFLQSLAYSGYINVDWVKVEHEYRALMDLDGDGKVTTNDVQLMMHKLQSVLLFNLPSGAGFTGGLYYGMGGSAAMAGKLGLSMGVGGIAARGLAVTGAPAIFSVVSEYDNGMIKDALDKGYSTAEQFGYADYIRKAGSIIGSGLKISPEDQLQSFKDSLNGQGLDNLRKLESDLTSKLAQSGSGDTLLEKKLNEIIVKKQEVKLENKKGWFW